MKIARQSPLTGKINELDIPGLTEADIDRWQSGELIQRAMPHISAAHREFLMSGMLPAEFEYVLDLWLHRSGRSPLRDEPRVDTQMME